jgi:hypothetical protein
VCVFYWERDGDYSPTWLRYVKWVYLCRILVSSCVILRPIYMSMVCRAVFRYVSLYGVEILSPDALKAVANYRWTEVLWIDLNVEMQIICVRGRVDINFMGVVICVYMTVYFMLYWVQHGQLNVIQICDVRMCDFEDKHCFLMSCWRCTCVNSEFIA